MDIAVLILALGLLMLVGAMERRVSRIDSRVARLEHKTDLVLERLGVELPGPDTRQVVALLRAGKKIEAIKVYRELTGAGLKEAKEAVERMPL